MSWSADARVALVAIGDELLAGKHPDLNSAWIAQRLLDLDLAVDRVVVANDDLEELAQVFRELCSRYEFVFATGGLGPTLDDITRHAAANAGGVSLVRDEGVVDALRARFEASGQKMAQANERQALFPDGAIVIENRAGTAPGFRVPIESAVLVCLPGPPREMHVVFDEGVLPWLTRAADSRVGASRVAKHAFHLFGLPESRFAEAAGAWMDRPQNPLMSVTVSAGVLSIVLRARAGSLGEAEAILAPRVSECRERFREYIFSEEVADLGAVLASLLLREGKKFAIAESCTGGLVAGRLTDAPGISEAFTHGFVTYADQAKIDLLGVSPELLREHGAVSAQVAEAMAAGACRAADADLAVAVTGIAGPSGGSEDKPVGTVWFGVAKGAQTRSVCRAFGSRGRDWVRTLATQTALDLARRIVPGADLPDLD